MTIVRKGTRLLNYEMCMHVLFCVILSVSPASQSKKTFNKSFETHKVQQKNLHSQLISISVGFVQKKVVAVKERLASLLRNTFIHVQRKNMISQNIFGLLHNY